MIGTYAAALAVCVASLAIGQAVIALCGRARWSWTAAPVAAKPQHWKDVVEEVAENLGFKAPDPGYVFPGELEPARKLADGLRSLANEVEQASIRAITDIPNSNSADSTLRSCLSELRALNEAETELDDSLKYRL